MLVGFKAYLANINHRQLTIAVNKRNRAMLTEKEEKGYWIEDLESKEDLLWWQKKGLMYTSTGYGRKIPTDKKVRLPNEKIWRRVYCCIYSNVGTCYVETKEKNWIVIE